MVNFGHPRPIDSVELHSILVSSVDGFTLVDAAGHILDANESYCQMVGYSREELLNMHMSEVDAIDSVEDVIIRSKEIMKNGSHRFQTKHRNKDGSSIDVEVTANYTSEHDGVFFSLVRDISGHKMAEQKLNEINVKFLNLVANIPGFVSYVNADTLQYEFANDLYVKSFNKTLDQIIGSHVRDIIGETIYQFALPYINEARSGNSASYEYEFDFALEKRWTKVNYNPVFDADGQVASIVVLSYDITEHKKNEESIRYANECFKQALNGSQHILYRLNIKTGYDYLSPSFEDITGHPLEEYKKTNLEKLAEYYHPDDLPDARTFIDQALRTRTGPKVPIEFEYRFKKADGSYCWLHDSTTACFNENDELEYYFGSAYDITERKQADTTIREISDRFSTAFNCAPIMMSISKIDDGTYLDVNQKYLDVSEFSRGEIIGRTSVELGWITESDRNKFKKILLQEGKVSRLGLNLKAKSGQVILCNFWGEVITIAGEKRLLSIALDITEQHKLEQQLQQAQKLESLGVLAGGIAHDFNNLLAVIIGHCSLAQLRPVKAIDNIQPIETAAQRAAALCQQMLAYAGKSNFIQSDIHLDELVNEMATMAKFSIGKNVDLKSDIASDIPAITVDASQIRQVVMNLIINASEAIGDSQGEVRVYLARRAVKAAQHTYDYLGNIIPPGWYACLEVTDNGCGMDEETQRRIFEPFYTTKFTGRGLGMSATLGIINKHNGALQLFSKPGMGSTFKVYIPIQTGEDGTSESPQQDTPIFWKSKGTVLLVEDEEEVMVVAEMMLEELGFSVMRASNGKEGLEMFQNDMADISLVITDIGMPVMDGYTLFRELKQLKPDLPIIISSGFGDKDITAHVPREEMSGLVSKPYNLGQLEEVLKGLVK